MSTVVEKESNLSNKLPLLTEVTIVKRNEIPAIHEVNKGGVIHSLGELRDFHKHVLLERFIPNLAHLSMAWAKLSKGESLATHKHPEASLIIICKGKGRLIGQKQAELGEGDIALIPPNCEHGFVCEYTEGLHALSIQFDEMGGLYENPEQALVEFINEKTDLFTLQDLLRFNNAKLEQFKQRPMFTMLQDGTLEDPELRKVFLDALQVWVDKNQLLLFTRQAMCRDEKYYATFLQHFQEEVNHDKMYSARESLTDYKDPVIDAIACWFIHQMFQLDNAEKAALIHLVIENGSHYYHQIARPILQASINQEYFDVHEADTEHAAMGARMLQGLDSPTYLRLKDIIEEGWEMIMAMVDRVVEIVEEYRAQKS
jgi:quercetin dioxygenase-like cupin family protein